MAADQDPAIGSLGFYQLKHQYEFGELLQGGIRHPAIIGGGGLGKTRLIVSASITLCGINIGLPMVATEPTYGMVVDILEPAIREACEMELIVDDDGYLVFEESFDGRKVPAMRPRERPIPYRYRARDHAFDFPWWGSSILCRSGEKPRRLRGPNLAAAAMDEAGDQVEEVFTTLQGRVRHPAARIRCIMVAGTPRGFDWMYDRWAAPGGERRLKNAALIRAKSYDNVLVTSSDPEWIASMKDSYDPELYKQEVEGEFVAIGQRSTYYAFGQENVGHGLRADPALPLIVCGDFNHVPLAWVAIQEAPAGQGGQIRVLAELDGPTTTDEACAEVQKLFGRSQFDAVDAARASLEGRAPPAATTYLFYGDATIWTPSQKKNYSDAEIIRDALSTSPRVARKNPRVRDRTNALNALLLNAAGRRRLLIDGERCPKLLRDLQQTRNIPGTLDIDGSNPDLTHWANALSYYAVSAHPVTEDGRRADRASAARQTEVLHGFR